MADSSAFAAFTAADADVCAILFSPLSMPAEVITSHAVLVQLHCKPVEYQVQTQPNKIMGAPSVLSLPLRVRPVERYSIDCLLKEKAMAHIAGQLLADSHPNGTVRIVFIAPTGGGNECPMKFRAELEREVDSGVGERHLLTLIHHGIDEYLIDALTVGLAAWRLVLRINHKFGGC